MSMASVVEVEKPGEDVLLLMQCVLSCLTFISVLKRTLTTSIRLVKSKVY